MNLAALRRPAACLATLAVALGLASMPGGATAAPAEPSVGAQITASLDDVAPRAARGERGARSSSAAAVDNPLSRRATLTSTNVAGPDAGRRLARSVVTQDLRTGRISAQVTLGAAPTANTLAVVFLGRWSSNTCVPGGVLLGETVGDGRGAAYLPPEGDAVDLAGASRSRKGAVLTVTSPAYGAFRTAEWTCAATYLAPSAQDQNSVVASLMAEDLQEVFAPRLELDRGVPVQGAARGKWTTVTVDVRNASRTDAAGVVLRASGKGLQIKPKKRSVGAIGGRSTKYGVTFQARVTGKAKQKPMTITASTGSYRTKARVTVAVAPKPRPYGSLAGRYFWGWDSTTPYRGWDNKALWFANSRFVHVGFPKRGKPSCSTVTKTCKRYTYNKRTGAVKIGKQRGKATTQQLTLGRMRYYPLSLPRKNSKLSAGLIHRNFTGCMGAPYCYTYTEWLSLDKQGRFIRSTQTIGSIGVPGSGSTWAGVGPDQRGRYQVLGNGRIKFSYSSGRTVVQTIGVEQDVRGKPSPGGAGVVIGDTNFYLD